MKVVEVAQEAKELFLPKGIDSNDNAEVVLSGLFTNLCYRYL